ncbi:MAG: hypothetical protein M1357_03065 [Candidatus Marsarchaeota archaeon]|nr:hypothetical protein [Candidatus Marsarchaeota archaeon]
MVCLTAFVEAFFNREFLAAVLPLGSAGVNIAEVSPAIRAFYVIGGYSFGVLTLLAPAALLASGILKPSTRLLATASLYASALGAVVAVAMDVQHVQEGINSIFQSSSAGESLILLGLVTCSVIFAALVVLQHRDLMGLALAVMLLTELLGILFLVGNIVTANFGGEGWSTLGGFSAAAEPYAGTLGGLLFAAAGGYRILGKKGGIRWGYVAALLVGVAIEYAVMANVFPGSSIVLGTIIIYDFGFLGVTDTLVPLVVFAGIASFITALFLLAMRGGQNTTFAGLTGLLLIITGFVYASETVTTYILLPSLAAAMASIWLANPRGGNAPNMEKSVRLKG